jgi:hypothetical protein
VPLEERKAEIVSNRSRCQIAMNLKTANRMRNGIMAPTSERQERNQRVRKIRSSNQIMETGTLWMESGEYEDIFDVIVRFAPAKQTTP